MSKNQKMSNKIDKVIINNPQNENENITWYNVVNAGKKEIDYLRKKFNFDLQHLKASTAKAISQRPITEVTDSYLFIILHFPSYIDKKIIPEEIDFFVGHGYLITLHNKNITALDDFFRLCKKDSNSTLSYKLESSSILLY